MDWKITVLTSWSSPPAMGPSSAEEKNLWSYFCNMQWRDQIMRVYYRSVSLEEFRWNPLYNVSCSGFDPSAKQNLFLFGIWHTANGKWNRNIPLICSWDFETVHLLLLNCQGPRVGVSSGGALGNLGHILKSKNTQEHKRSWAGARI